MSKSRDRYRGRLAAAAIMSALALVLSLPVCASADIRAFPVPEGDGPDGLVAAPDGLWFGGTAGLVRMLTDGIVTVMVPATGGPTVPPYITEFIPHPLAATPSGVWACWDSWERVGGCHVGSETPLLRVSSTGYQTFAGPFGPFPSCEEYRNYTNYVVSLTADPEGGAWFTMAEATGLGPSPRGVGHISPGGQISGDCFPGAFPTGSEPRSIAYGSDNALWFIARYAGPSDSDLVGRMTISGAFSYYPTGEQVIRDLTAGPSGTIWFTSEPGKLEPGQDHGAIDTITPSGIVTRFALPEGVISDSIAAGPDGALWFTATGIGNCGFGVGRLATTGTITYYDLSDALSGCPNPYESTIVAGPDGAMWLNAEGGGLIRITTSTPGSSTPMPTATSTAGSSTQVPVTSTVVRPIVVPPDVKRALNTAKLGAEVSKNAVDRADIGMLVFKLVLAAAEPEVAVELLMPDQFDAAEFLGGAQLADLAADPPRNDFTQIASPAYVPFASVTAHASRTLHRTRVWSILISDIESAAMYMRAFTLSVERLQGAAAQGECAWMRRQA